MRCLSKQVPANGLKTTKRPLYVVEVGGGFTNCLFLGQQEGATKEDVERVPKYKFRRLGDFEKQNGEIQESFGVMTECDTDTPIEHVLPLEDAECCICLCSYEDGIELRELPCRHHFHSVCIDKWLYMNATCPLCKFNIGNQCSSEDALACLILYMQPSK